MYAQANATSNSGFFNIVIVDDEQKVLNSLTRCLRPIHATITSFNSPSEALAYSQKNAIDLIISDYRMPNMNGVELLTEVNRYQPDAVSIILSGQTDFDALVKGINEAHIYQFIGKPWQDEDIQKSVKAALDHSFRLRSDHRLANQMRVKEGSMSRYSAHLQELESNYPGITHVQRDKNGYIVIKSN